MRAGALLLATLLATPAAPATLRVKASPVASPCVAAAGALFQRSTGRAIVVETGSVEAVGSADGSDVVVGANEELTRVLESGATDLEVDRELARIPWVIVGPSGGDVRSLARSGAPLRMLGGVVAREARRSLAGQGVTAQRLVSLDATRRPLAPAPGESLILPLSLAGRTAAVSTIAAPPLAIRAAAVRGTPRPGEARDFVLFLASGPGNDAFRACGREATR